MHVCVCVCVCVCVFSGRCGYIGYTLNDLQCLLLGSGDVFLFPRRGSSGLPVLHQQMGCLHLMMKNGRREHGHELQFPIAAMRGSTFSMV